MSRISRPISPTSTRSPETSIRKVSQELVQENDTLDRQKTTENNEKVPKYLDDLSRPSPLANSNSLSRLDDVKSDKPARLEDSALTNDSERFADADKSSPLEQNVYEQVGDDIKSQMLNSY